MTITPTMTLTTVFLTMNVTLTLSCLQMTEVSSPDLGVDVESSDPFSSLERGPKGEL